MVSRRRLRVAGVLALALALALIAVAPSALGGLGRWLVVADPIDKASVIVALVGHMPLRAIEAASLYRQGWAPEIWLTREDRDVMEAALTRFSISPPRDHEYSREVLLRSGVPSSAIKVLDPPIRNTMQEVELIARELQKMGGSRVILVTSKPHTRRVRATWWARVGASPKAIVRYAGEDRYDPSEWWRRTADVLAVSREIFGMVNVWAGFPVQPDAR